MEIREIENLKTISIVGDKVSIIDIDANEFTPYVVIDLEEDDLMRQRAITSNNELVHVVDAIVAGRYGCGGLCSWAFKVILEKDGLFEFSKKINKAIKNEYEARLANKKPYKRWRSNMRDLVIQLFIWDLNLLDEALENTDKFIYEYVRT